ncbi:MAG: hypothetical protein ABSA21_11375 [Candidatus Limnocylindrales bacterium]|jgi:hypothetical protein
MSETLLAVVIGGALTFAGGAFVEVLRNRSSTSREKTAREDARKDRLDEIQRATLLELQDQLPDWIEAVSKRAAARRAMARGEPSGHPGKALVGALVMDPEGRTIRHSRILTERIRDDALRVELVALQETATGDETRWVIQAVTEEDIIADFRDLSIAWGKAQSHLGVVLRSFL